MRKKERQEAIYEAALRVFARYGYRKTTVEDIARELGMTKGNLYLYARDKRGLYEKTVEYALLRWQTRVREAVALEKDARSMFVTMCTKAVEYLAMDEDFRRVLVHDPEIFPMFPVRDPYERINRNSMAMIRFILKKGMAEGDFRKVSPRTTPNAIFSIYKMFIIRMYIHPEGKEMRKFFEETLDLLTRGLFRD
jgi:AcrR family transcriptional regulator